MHASTFVLWLALSGVISTNPLAVFAFVNTPGTSSAKLNAPSLLLKRYPFRISLLHFGQIIHNTSFLNIFTKNRHCHAKFFFKLLRFNKRYALIVIAKHNQPAAIHQSKSLSSLFRNNYLTAVIHCNNTPHVFAFRCWCHLLPFKLHIVLY